MTEKARDAVERARAIALLQHRLKAGDRLYTILRSVSGSGMTRHLDIYRIVDGKPLRFSKLAADAAGYGWNRTRAEIRTEGGGLDVGHQLVYDLGRLCFPDGFGCVGDKCRSNDHSNGDHSYRKHTKAASHWHKNGGYAFVQEWL